MSDNELVIVTGFHVDCYRCAETAFIEESGQVTKEQAQALLLNVGWGAYDDGYQMCPKCWGAR